MPVRGQEGRPSSGNKTAGKSARSNVKAEIQVRENLPPAKKQSTNE